MSDQAITFQCRYEKTTETRKERVLPRRNVSGPRFLHHLLPIVVVAAAAVLAISAPEVFAAEITVDETTPLAKLQVLLKDDNASVRLSAINELGQRGTAAQNAVPALKRMLQKSDFDEFPKILDAIENIMPAEEASCYAMLLKRPLNVQQCNAVVGRVVKNLPPKQALSVLDTAMKDYKDGKGVGSGNGGALAAAMRSLGEDGIKMANRYWKKDRVGSPGAGQR